MRKRKTPWIDLAEKNKRMKGVKTGKKNRAELRSVKELVQLLRPVDFSVYVHSFRGETTGVSKKRKGKPE